MKTEKQIALFQKALAARIKNTRLEKRLSKNELSSLSGISRQGIRLIEEGHRVPSTVTLWQVCSGMEISLSSLLEGLD